MSFLVALCLVAGAAAAALWAGPVPLGGAGAGAARRRIFVLGDNRVMRQGLQLMIGLEPNLAGCGEADPTPAGIRLLEQSRPDGLILDLSSRENGGPELLGEILGPLPDLAIVVLSSREEPFFAERMLQIGARGYVTTREGSAGLIEAVHKSLAGEAYINGRIADALIHALVGGSTGEHPSPIRRLTDRELEVFELIGSGQSTRAIAKKLTLSAKTVGSHREHIKRKLEIDSATGLLKRAMEWMQASSNGAGVLPPPESPAGSSPEAPPGSWRAAIPPRPAPGPHTRPAD